MRTSFTMSWGSLACVVVDVLTAMDRGPSGNFGSMRVMMDVGPSDRISCKECEGQYLNPSDCSTHCVVVVVVVKGHHRGFNSGGVLQLQGCRRSSHYIKSRQREVIRV